MASQGITFLENPPVLAVAGGIEPPDGGGEPPDRPELNALLLYITKQKYRIPEADAREILNEVVCSFMLNAGSVKNARAWMVAATCNASRHYCRERAHKESGVQYVARNAIHQALKRLNDGFQRVFRRGSNGRGQLETESDGN
jgi:hypothetical protein